MDFTAQLSGESSEVVDALRKVADQIEEGFLSGIMPLGVEGSWNLEDDDGDT